MLSPIKSKYSAVTRNLHFFPTFVYKAKGHPHSKLHSLLNLWAFFHWTLLCLQFLTMGGKDSFVREKHYKLSINSGNKYKIESHKKLIFVECTKLRLFICTIIVMIFEDFM